MSNVIISTTDLTLTSTLSGGSWLSTLPLNNLKNQLVSKLCRSTNDDAASSIILADLGSAQAVRFLSLCNHNISSAGTVRVRGYSDSGYTTLVTGADSTALAVWPSGFTATDVSKNPNYYTFCFATPKSARYWKIEVVDTSNPSNYIQLGRLWIGQSDFEPIVGVSYGAGLGYVARDVVEESLGGVDWIEQKTAKREFTANFEALNVAEERKLYTMQRTLTTAKESFILIDPLAAIDDMINKSFICRFKTLSLLNQPYFDNRATALGITETI